MVREGDNVSLSCEASGYPPPHIVWRREDGDDILLGGRKVRFPVFRDVQDGAQKTLDNAYRKCDQKQGV